jgi:hypothetical protein
MGQQVWLMNPWNQKQKIAAGFVSPLGGTYKFNFNTIPDSWIKVDVKGVMSPNEDFMYPHEAGN